jgi:putative tricarboxylic transport membrane protein
MAEDVKSSEGAPRSDGEVLTNPLRGGVLVIIAGALLLLASFVIPNPIVPRILSIIICIVGIATAAGFIRARAPQDYYGGLVLVILATFMFVASADLPGQRGFAFGPGTAPRLFSWLMAGLGTAVTLVGVMTDGPAIEKYRIRGPALVVFAIFLFASLIRPFGLVVATYVTFMVSIMGSREMRWIESLIAAAFMTAGCVVLFVYLLGLPFQLWPVSNAFLILWTQFEDIAKELFLIAEQLLHVA